MIRILLAVAAVLTVLGIVALRSTWSSEGREAVAPPEDRWGALGSATDDLGDQESSTLVPEETVRRQRSPVDPESRDALPAAAPSTHEVAGFCVDADGDPVAGALVRVAVAASDPREKLVVESISDASGEFYFARDALELPFWLCFEAERFVPVRLRVDLDGSTEGRVDVGEVTLPTGVRIRGSVESSRGQPVAEVQIVAERRDGTNRTGCIEDPQRAISTITGAFDLGWCLPGRYFVETPGKEQLSPTLVTLGPPPETEFMVIVVADDSELLSVEGTVTDTLGEPLAGARVQAAQKRGKRRITETDAGGWFTIERPVGEAKPVEVSACAEGYDVAILPEEVAWGDRGLHLVLREAAVLEIRVSEDTTGAPVTAFGIRLQRFDGHALAPLDLGARLPRIHEGAHPGGVLRIPGVYRGRYLLRVEPTGDAGVAASPYLFVAVEGLKESVLNVALPATVERTLRVVTPAGSPIAGCRIVTCLQGREPTGLDTEIVDAVNWGRVMIDDRALLLQQEVTGDDGSLLLRGPAATRIAIRFDGPGCLPHVLDLEQLEGVGPLEHVALVGGRLRFTTLQPEILRELAGILPRSPSIRLRGLADSYADRRRLPSVVLSLPEPTTIIEAPEGVWEPVLELSDDEVALAPVRVTTGESIEVPLDLTELQPVVIRGRVLRPDGVLSLTECHLQRWLPKRGRSASPWRRFDITTDAAGGFTFEGLPGRYRLMVPSPSGDFGTICASPRPIQVEPGQRLEQEFLILTGELRLRLVDGEGASAPGVQGIQVMRAPGEDLLAELDSTDEEGRVRLPDCEAGTFFLRVLPRRLGERKVQIELLMKSGDPGAVSRQQISLGSVTVEEGDEKEMVVVLPAAYFE